MATSKIKLQEPQMALYLAIMDVRDKIRKADRLHLSGGVFITGSSKPSAQFQLPLFFSSNSRMSPLMWDSF